MRGAQPMDPVDAAWLRMNRPVNPMVITAVVTLATEPDWDVVRRVFAERVLARHPRFRQRVVVHRGRPRWAEAPDFDLDRHFVPVVGPVEDEQALQALVGRLMSAPLDLEHPPWILYRVAHYGAGAALVARLHHCLADGISLARVLLALTDPLEPDAERPPVKVGAPPRPRGLGLARALPGLGRALGHLLGAPPDPPTALRGPLGTEKRAAWSPALPLHAVKAAARTAGGTVNDVFVDAVTAGLGAWLRSRGSPARQVRAFVPVNLRPPDEPLPRLLGNRFGMVMLPLPVGEVDPTERLRLVERAMRRLTHTGEAYVVFALLQLLGRLPPWLERLAVSFFGRKASLVLTNVPGPRGRVALGGAPVELILPWVPQSGNVALGISLFSYAGALRIGVAADAGLVPDPAALVACITDALRWRQRAPSAGADCHPRLQTGGPATRARS